MKSHRARVWVIWVCFGVSLALTFPKNASALGRDKRTIATSALYGLAAGTAMGLIAVPSTQSGKSVLIGSSIGLYLGVAVGLYHMYHREDPENPLSPYSSLERGRDPSSTPSGPSSMDSKAGNQPFALRVDFRVAEF